MAGYGADLCARLFSNVILTRLLFPEAFGVIAAATALIVGLVLVSDFGVRAVIIQSPRGDQVGFLRSAWVFQLWRGMLLWIVLLGLCALLSLPTARNALPQNSIFADRSFAPMMAVLGFTVVLAGAESTSLSLNVRQLNYRSVTIVDLVGRISSIPVTIVWAWISPSAWALVGGILVGGLSRVVLSHTYVAGPRMSFSWERHHFREIIGFGRWIVIASFATFISQQSDVIVLGILMPGSVLGLYSIAKLLAGVGEGFIDRLNASLALPVLGEVIRKNPENLRDHYYRFRLPMELAAGFLSGALFVAGYFIVSFLYDARYEQAGLMLQILALGTLCYPFSIIASAFTATGDTHVAAYISILKAVSLVVCVIAGYHVAGVMGAIGGVAAHRIVPSIATVLLAHQRRWIGLWQEFRIIPAFLIGAFIAKGVVLIAADLGLENIHQLLHFRTHGR